MKNINRLLVWSLFTVLIGFFSSISAADTKFDSYTGLVMAGYQAWFNAEGDGADRGWKHWEKSGSFRDGSCTIDFWPDMSEYEKKYKTSFKFPDGSPAYVFSSYDYSTVDLHFKWMQEYDIDGAFCQRFIHKLDDSRTKNHYMKTIDHAIKAAEKYNRAVSIRYDISGSKSSDFDLWLSDFKSLRSKYGDFKRDANPTFLYHNGKPLIAIGGVGFKDNGYDSDIGYLKLGEKMITELQNMGYSVMLRVPNMWRKRLGTQMLTDADRLETFYKLVKRCDIILPWHVGGYHEDSYTAGNWPTIIKDDIQWCDSNNVEYVPVLWPGFSWWNMKKMESSFRPRNNGSFFWVQVEGAISAGANKIFLAQFDEVDEGTQFFKCTVGDNVPGSESIFQSYEESPEQYLEWAQRSRDYLETSLLPPTVFTINGSRPSSGISIFPNPSNGVFNVQGPWESSKVTYEVVNSQRSILKGSSTERLPYAIDMQDEDKGVYILRINQGGKMTSKKLIVQ